MMAPEVRIRVDPEEAGTRLDSYLSRKLAVSRNKVRHWIKAGAVSVNSLDRKPSYAVAADDEIAVASPPDLPSHLEPEPIPLSILYEDEHLVVVDKPAGLIVHPGAGNRTGTLANALAYHFQQMSRADTLRPGIVHRLDKQTSGVLVVAKSDAVHEALAQQFKRRAVGKEYLALLFGRLEKKSGTIELPLGRDRRDRKKISPRSRKLRTAVTEYKVIRAFSEFTLVKATPQTGRTHQIRVHFSELGHPVAGDRMYGRGRLNHIRDDRARSLIRRMDRHFLHASSISFMHPETGGRVRLTSPLPNQLEQLLHALEE